MHNQLGEGREVKINSKCNPSTQVATQQQTGKEGECIGPSCTAAVPFHGWWTTAVDEDDSSLGGCYHTSRAEILLDRKLNLVVCVSQETRGEEGGERARERRGADT